ncbi:MAG: MarR family transcriptional regulator [Acidimicrobiaceae bacterium]|nr:MarR family transcriptional regulator [Acidimicrobiaceae bacterium]
MTSSHGVAKARAKATATAKAAQPATRISLEDSVGFRLSRLVRVRRERWASELETLGLTPPQAAILRATRDHPNQALRALARTLKSDVMAVKRCVDGLESRQWVATSTRDDDRRVRTVTLTKQGVALMGRLDEFVHHQESTLRSQLSPSQLQVFSELLEHLERAEGIGVEEEIVNNEQSEEHS